MMSLSEQEWNTFEIQDVFEVINLKPEHKVNLKSLGTTPYITRTEKNNGVENFYKGLHIKKGNCITFGAETAKFYYQEYNFINGNKLYAIYNEHLNKYIALFLITLFKNQFLDYGYGFGLTGTRFSKKKIKLPTLNNQPDYNFMEQYIKEKYFNLKSQIKDKQKHEIYDCRELNEVEWNNFKIGDIANVNGGKDLPKYDRKTGDIPFIGSSSLNNGITDFININHENTKVAKKCIGINRNGSVGYSFYHPYYAYYSGDTRFIKTENDNKYANLFLVNIISNQRGKYAYGYKMGTQRIKKQIIKLPSINNQPDYSFMEQYMKRKENKILDRL